MGQALPEPDAHTVRDRDQADMRGWNIKDTS